MKIVIVVVSLIVGIIFLIVAGVYFVTSANHLPMFFPGFDASVTKAHIKHGIGALVLAVAAFVFAWFQSGKKSSKK